MAKIYAPNKEYTGVSASVPFVNGVGESDNPVLLSWFEAHGYEVEKPKTESKQETTPGGDKPLDKDKINKEQLLAIAAAEGVTVPDGSTKADIVKLIEEART
jgi:hypothetical protein